MKNIKVLKYINGKGVDNRNIAVFDIVMNCLDTNLRLNKGYIPYKHIYEKRLLCL